MRRRYIPSGGDRSPLQGSGAAVLVLRRLAMKRRGAWLPVIVFGPRRSVLRQETARAAHRRVERVRLLSGREGGCVEGLYGSGASGLAPGAATGRPDRSARPRVGVDRRFP